MIRRPPRSTLSSSSAASDVYKRQFLPILLMLRKKNSAKSATCGTLANPPTRGKMTKLHTVTVYAGSADNLPKIYLDGAYALGKLLAEQGRVLVFGAGKTGLMGAVADGALDHGGEVIGVINDGLNLCLL